MTLIGAIKQLHELRCAEDMPIYYKPAIAEVINVLLMDAQEVRHGRWIYEGKKGRFPACRCSECGNVENADWAVLGDNVNYCPNCGAKMDLEGEEA